MRITLIASDGFSDSVQVSGVLYPFLGIHEGKDVEVSAGWNSGFVSAVERVCKERRLPFSPLEPKDPSGFSVMNKEIAERSDRVIAFWNGRPGAVSDLLDKSERFGGVTYVVVV